MDYYDSELYHYGVKGMKWGVRKKGYVTVAKAQKNATKAANDARKKSLAESRASGDTGIGSFQRANRKALNAKRKAYGESIAKDRAYNKQLKEENKLNKIAKKDSKVDQKYKEYKRIFELSDAGAKQQLSPTQYARWTTSGARKSQQMRLKDLKKASEKATSRTRDYMRKLDENYVITYDVQTRTYSLARK